MTLSDAWHAAESDTYASGVRAVRVDLSPEVRARAADTWRCGDGVGWQTRRGHGSRRIHRQPSRGATPGRVRPCHGVLRLQLERLVRMAGRAAGGPACGDRSTAR